MSGRKNTTRNQNAVKPNIRKGLTERRRRKKDVEFEEIRDNLMLKQREERKNERQNLVNREM